MANLRKKPYLLLYKILGFYPLNIDLYQLALLHKSSSRRDKNGQILNNERLEFLGDAILSAIISDILYFEYPRKSEGFLTNTRSKIVQRESLNQLAIELGLDKLTKINRRQDKVLKHNIYGNAFEAFIGAIYLDRGYEKCRQFISSRVLHRLINLEQLAKQEFNFKSKLIEWGQKNRIEIDFQTIERSDTNMNVPVFQTEALVQKHIAGIGVGLSKKESQQKASQLALHKIGKQPMFWDISEKEVSQEEVLAI